jgi:hypothetical protein
MSSEMAVLMAEKFIRVSRVMTSSSGELRHPAFRGNSIELSECHSRGTQKAQRKKRKKHKPNQDFFAHFVLVLRILCSKFLTHCHCA